MKPKQYIILGTIIVIYILFSYFITNYFQKENSKYLFIDDSVKWQYSNDSWANIGTNIFQSLDLSDYKVYNMYEKQLVGIYDIKQDNNVWYTKSDNSNYVEYENMMLAYKGNDKFSMVSYEETELDGEDYDIIDSLLDELDLKYNSLNIKSKIDLDFDNDGDIETIYTISNMFSEETETSYFSIVFYYDNKKTNVMDKNIVTDSSLENRIQSDVLTIIDINGNNKYQVITETSPFSRPEETVYTLYQMNNNTYKKLIANS